MWSMPKPLPLPQHKILFSYVLRNALPPQITDLALSLGVIFGGQAGQSMSFPIRAWGRFYMAILQGDFNLMMGVTVFSVVGIATAALFVDLTYPLFDSRIRVPIRRRKKCVFFEIY